MRARWPSGLFVMRKLSPPGWIATSRVSFEMSTPTLCATVDLIFSQSSSCLGGITPGCPFRPLGKERGGQTTGQSFQIGALYDPSPPAAGLCRRQAGGARSCRIRRENDKTSTLDMIDGQMEAIDRRLKTLRNADSDLC